MKQFRDPIIDLLALELELEQKAVSDYKNCTLRILKCKKCKVSPDHSYDSFGMPMHKLGCPECGRFAEWPKEFIGVVKAWNAKNRKVK